MSPGRHQGDAWPLSGSEPCEDVAHAAVVDILDDLAAASVEAVREDDGIDA